MQGNEDKKKGIYEFGLRVFNEYEGKKNYYIVLGTCEVNLIWSLARNGAQSVYQLHRNRKGRIIYTTPDVNAIFSGPAGNPVRDYSYPFVHRNIWRLRQLGLVEIERNVTSRRRKNRVSLTLLGLLVYIEGSKDKDKPKITRKDENISLFPFHTLLGTLIEKLGEKRIFDTILRTTFSFENIEVCEVTTESGKFELLTDTLIVPGTELAGDKEVYDILRTSEAALLRESHLAYLIARDLWRRSKQEPPYHYDSEEEMETFKRKGALLPEFANQRQFYEFVAKYSTPELVFTGMFVEKLLFDEELDDREKQTGRLIDKEREVDLP